MPGERKKVNLAYIVNDVARRISYQKRKKGLLKKLNELTTLCGIEGFDVIDSEFETRPEVWQTPREFERLVTKYKNVPHNMQIKKSLNQESFLMQRTQKTRKQLEKMKKNNKGKEMPVLISQGLFQPNVMFNPDMVDLYDMVWLINHKLEKVRSRLNALDKMDSTTENQTRVVASAVAEEAGVDHGPKV